jgi:threonine dehydrogenase-like Zn-dependent dehydrogenase
MKQSVIVEPQHSVLVDRDVPQPGPNEVMVHVKTCGVCASELHGWKGDQYSYPREYGHEVAGEVVAVGSQVTSFQPGMRVTGLFSKGFAEYSKTPQEFVTSIPDGVSYEEALGEPIACVMSGARRTNIDLGDTVAMVGLGFMGMLMLEAARLRGPARIIAIDPRREVLDSAMKFGADEVYTPNEVPERLMLTEWGHLGKGRGADVVFESSGTQPGLTLAGQLVRDHGILSLVGWHQGGLRQVDVEMWNWKGFDIINAHERRMDYLMDCMHRGLALVAAGKLNIAELISHRFPLNAVDDAFRALADKPPGYHKAVIVIEGEES